MISGEKIAEYISNPSQITHADLVDFAELIKKYPYCSSLYLLHLKGLALNNDLDFEDQLKITAIHASDREHLYALIHSGEKSEATIEEVETADPVQETQPDTEAIQTHIEQPIETSEEVITSEIITSPEVDTAEPIQETEPIVEAIQSTIEEPKDTSEKIKANQHTANPEVEETAPIQIDEEVETETPRTIEEITAIEADLTDHLETDIINQAIGTAFVSSALESEISAPDPIIEEKEELNEPSVALSTTSTEEIIPEESAPRELSFIEWLRHKQDHIIAHETGDRPTEISFEKEIEKVALEVAPELVEEISDDKIETTTIAADTEEPTEEKETSKKNIDALLDKFMEEEPRISKPVKDFYNPVKNAQKSVEESADLVSETLAKIHVLQKNYSKAISAYEKLILLYPEKKTFFASRIEKIREESKKR